jgi:hypothetical protein
MFAISLPVQVQEVITKGFGAVTNPFVTAILVQSGKDS